jgi:hypothetical protein
MNCLDDLETSIIIQKEIDKCNEKIKKYEIKYNDEKRESLQMIYEYLTSQSIICDEYDKKIINDDINILKQLLE